MMAKNGLPKDIKRGVNMSTELNELIYILENDVEAMLNSNNKYIDEAVMYLKSFQKEKWLTEIQAKQKALKDIIDMLTIQHDVLACSSYPMSKEKR